MVVCLMQWNLITGQSVSHCHVTWSKPVEVTSVMGSISQKITTKMFFGLSDIVCFYNICGIWIKTNALRSNMQNQKWDEFGQWMRENRKKKSVKNVCSCSELVVCELECLQHSWESEKHLLLHKWSFKDERCCCLEVRYNAIPQHKHWCRLIIVLCHQLSFILFFFGYEFASNKLNYISTYVRTWVWNILDHVSAFWKMFLPSVDYFHLRRGSLTQRDTKLFQCKCDDHGLLLVNAFVHRKSFNFGCFFCRCCFILSP